MKKPPRLRVSRTTMRTLDAADLAGGGPPLFLPTFQCLSGPLGAATCMPSGAEDCQRTRLLVPQ
jgi:hypothetical protein